MKKVVENINVEYKNIYRKAKISQKTYSSKWIKIRVLVYDFRNIIVLIHVTRFSTAK